MLTKRLIYIFRTLLVISIIYFIYYISAPLNERLEFSPLFYETDKNQFIYNIQGLEWALFAIFEFFLGLILWHTVFWSIIKGKNFFFGKVDRMIVLKLFDYIWYLVGFTSILLLLIGLNAKEIMKDAKNEQEQLKFVKEFVFSTMEFSDKSCEEIKNIKIVNIKQLSFEDPEDAEDYKFYQNDILFYKKLCIVIKENKNHYSKVKKLCSGYEGDWSWGNNEPKYFQDKKTPEKVANALNNMHAICSGMEKIEDTRKTLATFKRASNKIFTNNEKNNPLWYILFPLVISFRLVKTTAELTEAIRKSKTT